LVSAHQYSNSRASRETDRCVALRDMQNNDNIHNSSHSDDTQDEEEEENEEDEEEESQDDEPTNKKRRLNNTPNSHYPSPIPPHTPYPTSDTEDTKSRLPPIHFPILTPLLPHTNQHKKKKKHTRIGPLITYPMPHGPIITTPTLLNNNNNNNNNTHNTTTTRRSLFMKQRRTSIPPPEFRPPPPLFALDRLSMDVDVNVLKQDGLPIPSPGIRNSTIIITPNNIPTLPNKQMREKTKKRKSPYYKKKKKRTPRVKWTDLEVELMIANAPLINPGKPSNWNECKRLYFPARSAGALKLK